ncbi:hypothetical protein [Streptodolium elevatio]|uniref:Uncharacterized protein n=1 Tax=Streptodolium elevatio TaxID=3157996 RepID=A0ABV3DBW9_9ACTN
MEEIQNRVRELLVIVRDVDGWRDDHEEGVCESPTWDLMCELSRCATRLIFSLPIEMLPPEEVRTPSPREYAFLDWMIALIEEVQQGK